VPYSATGGGITRPRRPFEGSPREPPDGRLAGPHGPGVAFRHPRIGDFCSRFALIAPHDPPSREAAVASALRRPAGPHHCWCFAACGRTGPPGLSLPTRDRPSRRRSPATLGVGTDVPSQAGDAASMLASRVAGICLRRLPSSMVNRARAARGIFPRQGRGKFRRLEISTSIGPVPTRVRHELVNGGAVLPAEIGPTVR
jgi:hypothetical protein